MCRIRLYSERDRNIYFYMATRVPVPPVLAAAVGQTLRRSGRVPVPPVLADAVAAARSRSTSRVFSPYFAPYVDVTAWPTPDLSALLSATQADYLTLAFVTSNKGGATSDDAEPAWGGVAPIAWTALLPQITAIGPDRFIVSFGGAAGTELAVAVTDETALFEKYASVVDTTGILKLDFDVEGSALDDAAANGRRARALARLQAARPGVTVRFTLPVMQTGLLDDGLALARQASSTRGLTVSVYNLMVMDYGTHESHMGVAALSAGAAVQKQLGLGTAIGLTPMIGKNDTGEIFTLDDARLVVNGTCLTSVLPSVAWLSFWSAARDAGAGPDASLDTSSQIAQAPYAFSAIFSTGIKAAVLAGR